MFIIASTGRCATKALCDALNASSDHQVVHEPRPWLIHEAFLKHTEAAWRTPILQDELKKFASLNGSRFGQSFRAPNLLTEIRAVAPATRFLIVIRSPLDYIQSANAMRVFRKGNDWDQTRIVPLDLELRACSTAEKIAWHWVEVNRYLLEFAEQHPDVSLTVESGRMNADIFRWTQHLGVQINDSRQLEELLARRVNASPESAPPEGYDPQALTHICCGTWQRAQRLMWWQTQ